MEWLSLARGAAVGEVGRVRRRGLPLRVVELSLLETGAAAGLQAGGRAAS
ncbi:hypothetical protein [Streptomyces sp. NPDC002851]